MDWTTIITAFIGVLFGGGFIEFLNWILFIKPNKKQKEAETELKENEVRDASTDTQIKQMNMADQYFEGMMKMLEKVQTGQERGNVNQEEIISKLNILDKRMDKMEIQFNYMESYLNGPYHAWLAEKEKEINNK
jgi:hypothetical protein